MTGLFVAGMVVSLKIVLAGCAAAVVAMCGASAQAATELVVNGGFETGDLTGWTLTNNPTASFIVTAPHSGDFALASSEFGHVAVLSQTIATEAGRSYHYEFWVRKVGPPLHDRFRFSFGGLEYVALPSSSAFPYTRISGDAPAFEANSALQFQLRADNGTWRLDDVSVTANGVPEPAGWALMIGGFALTGLGLRRRRIQQRLA